MAVSFRDKDGTTRLAGDLLIGGTTGDVATVQADGTIGPAPGGSQPITLVGPHTVNYDTTGFVNPPSDLGIDTVAVPAGSLLLAVALVITDTWDGWQHNMNDYFQGCLAAVPAGPAASLSWGWDVSSPDNPTIGLSAAPVIRASVEGGSVTAISSALQFVPALAVADCHVVLAAFTAGAITGGSLDVYALLATPS